MPFNVPAPVSKIPVMIGGSGEKKTLRMVAQYADESNLVGTPTHQIPRKLDALAAHCERLGRDRSEITVTKLQMVCRRPDDRKSSRPTSAPWPRPRAGPTATSRWREGQR